MIHNTLRRRRLVVGALFGAASLLVASCGSDDDTTTDADETTEATDAAEDENGDENGDEEAAGDVLVVEMSDYAYDLPDEVAVGTTLEIVNVADDEVHELILFRLNDGEDRSFEELLELGEEAFMALGEMRGVGFAAPASDDAVYPYGPLVVDEAGRWVAFCMIPTGADPDEWLEAAETSEGPPQVDGGPPHAVMGMAVIFDAS